MVEVELILDEFEVTEHQAEKSSVRVSIVCIFSKKFYCQHTLSLLTYLYS